ncbi:unnamed protein product [Amoebophrya sp. A120]|nr:unnamed protein product [Amoebophrya sp. A120]|eukprot:GSA120T00015734001.1
MPIDFSPARENSEEAANPIASAFPPPRENSEEAGANPSANTSPEPEAAQPAADAPPEPKVIINKRKKKMSKEEKFQQMKDDTKKTEVIALIESERKRCAAEGLSMHPEVAKLMLEVIGDPLEVPEAMRVQEAFDIGKKQISLELLKEPSTSSHGPTVTSSSTQLSSSIASFYLQQKVKVKTHVKLGYDLGALGEEYHKNMEVFIQKQKLMKRENAKKLLTQDYKNKEKGISDKTGKIISIHHPSTLASEQEKVAEKHSETIKNREKIRDAQMFVSRKYLPAVYERVVIEKVMETSGGAVPGLFPGKNDNLTNKYGSPFLQMDTLPEPNNNQKSSNKNKTRKQTNHSGPSSTTASGVTTAAQTTTAGYYMASSAATTAQDGQEFRESDTWKNTRRSIDIYGVNPEFLRSGNMASEFNAVASYYDDIAEAREQQVLFMSQTALAQQQQLGGNNTSTQSQQQQKEMMAQTYHAGTGPFYQPQNNGNSNNSGNKLYHHRPRAETQNTKLAKISEKPPATLDEMEADVRGDFEQSRPKRRSDSRSVPPPASNPGADGSGAPGPAETNVKMGTPQNTVEDFDIPQYNYPLPDVVSSAEQTYKTSSENEDLLLNEQSKNTAGSLGTDEDRSLTASSRPKTKDSIIPPSVVAASPYGQIEVLNLDDMQEKKREKKRKKTAGGTTSGGNTNPSSKNNSLNNTKSSGFSTQSKESKKSSGQGSIADTSKEHSTTKPLASPYAGDQVEMLLSGSGSDVNSKKKTTTTSPKRKKTTDPAAKKKKQHQSTTSKESKMTDTSKLDSEEFPMPSGSDDKVVSGTEEESGSGTAPATTSETEQNQVKPAEQTEPLDEPIASDDEQYQNEEFEQEEVEETPMNNEGDHTFSKPTTAQTEFLERNVTSSGSTAIGSGGKLVSSSGKMKAGTSASKSSQGGQKKSSSTSKPPRTSSSHLSISTAGSSEGQKENQNQVEHFPFPTVAENEIFSPQDNVLGSESPLGAAVQNHVGMDTRTGKLELVENQDKLQQRLLPFGVSDDMTPGEKPAAVPPRSRGAVPSSRESSTTNAGRMTTPAASSGARNRPSTKSSSERKVPGSSGGANSRGKTPAASSSSRGNPGATTSSQSSQRPQHGGTRPSSTAKQPSPPASSQSTTREREQRRAGEQQPRTSAQQTTSTAQVAAPITTTTAQQGESATPEENYSDDEFEEDDQFILENNMPTIWAGDPQAASMFAPNDNVEQQSTRPNSSAAGSMVSFSRPGTQQSMFPPGNQPGTRPGTSSGNADNLFPFDEPATATQAGANNGMTTQGNNSTNSVGRPGTSEFQHRPGTSSSASISTQQVLSQSNFNNSQNQQVTFATEFATPDPFGNILIRPDSSSYGENDSLRDSKSSRKKRKSSRSSKSRGGDRDRENLSSAHHSREISGELFAGEFSESRPNTGSNSIRSHSRSSRQSNRPQLAEPNEFDFQGEFDPEEDTARKQRKRRNKDRSL